MIQRNGIVHWLCAIAQSSLIIDKPFNAKFFCGNDKIGPAYTVSERVFMPVVGILVGCRNVNNDITLELLNGLVNQILVGNVPFNNRQVGMRLEVFRTTCCKIVHHNHGVTTGQQELSNV